ncbi:MAG: DUF1893 domain-containing protein [Bacillota bacterium]
MQDATRRTTELAAGRGPSVAEARRFLEVQRATYVVVRANRIVAWSCRPSVKALFVALTDALRRAGARELAGAAMAGLAISRSVALAAVRWGLADVYGEVMTREAAELLRRQGVRAECRQLVADVADEPAPNTGDSVDSGLASLHHELAWLDRVVDGCQSDPGEAWRRLWAAAVQPAAGEAAGA